MGEKGELTVNRGDSRRFPGTSQSLLPVAEERDALLGFLGFRLSGSLALFPLGLLHAVDLTGLWSGCLALARVGLGHRFGLIGRGLGGARRFGLWGWRGAIRRCRGVAGRRCGRGGRGGSRARR